MKRRTAPRKKTPVSRNYKVKSKSKKGFSTGKIILYAAAIALAITLVATVYQYRNGFLYYLGFKTDKVAGKLSAEERKIADVRIFEILSRHDTKLVGFDVSEYQDKIDWKAIDKMEGEFPLSFVFIRSTAGNNYVDGRFEENWKEAKKNHFVRGAYHYYRPNENSLEQAELFIKTVKLQKGDFPPVLDIEKLPEGQSMDSLKVGLKRWLKRVERHYKVKPIIYSGESYYKDFLKDEFKGYQFWIANYNFFVENIKDEWLLWQFTEQAEVDGIKGLVDINVFNGNGEDLRAITIKK
ncbi:glycoside hydrolase family 25 protein [Flavobacterium sp.]|uniref:glycoside hydrolase family 25 protein n=1 Tax=Flavobacterium sp. TaxID=239 RepID=UPI00262467A8|nr:glycoside hydrolase family 25 protein [Flavobacterium sp.]